MLDLLVERQFLELMQKPDVDSIEGLSPAISIDQKTTSRNPRSTEMRCWPDGIWPLASAIDTDLPTPPENVNLMLAHAPAWTGAPSSSGKSNFAEYPEHSIEDWHKIQGLLVD